MMNVRYEKNLSKSVCFWLKLFLAPVLIFNNTADRDKYPFQIHFTLLRGLQKLATGKALLFQWLSMEKNYSTARWCI